MFIKYEMREDIADKWMEMMRMMVKRDGIHTQKQTRYTYNKTQM
jgi:hypothetical protein